MQVNKVEICAILETRVKLEKFTNVSKKMLKDWNHNYGSSHNRRIWVAWKPRKFDVCMVVENAQGICCKVTNIQSGVSFHFIAVYGFNTMELRRDLWRFLLATCSQITGPVICSGDFNTVLLVDDRFNGSPVTDNEIRDFDDCI